MRKLLLLLLLLLPVTCWGTTIATNSVTAITTAPAGNAVNGALVETITGQSNYILIYNGNGTLTMDLGIDSQNNYLDIVNGVGSLKLITDSTEAMAETPIGNAVNGSFIESIIAQTGIINIENGNLVLAFSGIDATGNAIIIVNSNIGDYRLEDGYEMSECEIWNPGLLLLSSPANNVDVIMINGF